MMEFVINLHHGETLPARPAWNVALYSAGFLQLTSIVSRRNLRFVPTRRAGTSSERHPHVLSLTRTVATRDHK